jgi:hypothetical protein
MALLRHLAEDGRRILREVAIRQRETTIGRGDDNALIVAHPSVSRHHARLVSTPTGYRIVDDDSVNGVWVRNQRVQDGAIVPGEMFRVGDCLLQIVDEAASAPGPKPEPYAAPSAPAPRSGGGCGIWVALLVFLLAGGGCLGGVLLYVLRDRWMPLVSGGTSVSQRTDDGGATGSGGGAGSGAGGAVTPTCPNPEPRQCPWALPGGPTGSCLPGFCFDGGPDGSALCKQEDVPSGARRNDVLDVECGAGAKPVVDPCTGAIKSCRP